MGVIHIWNILKWACWEPIPLIRLYSIISRLNYIFLYNHLNYIVSCLNYNVICFIYIISSPNSHIIFQHNSFILFLLPASLKLFPALIFRDFLYLTINHAIYETTIRKVMLSTFNTKFYPGKHGKSSGAYK